MDHTGQLHCRRAWISHWRSTSSCQDGGLGVGRGEVKEIRGEREKLHRLCAGREWLTVLFLRISPCVISTLGSAGKQPCKSSLKSPWQITWSQGWQAGASERCGECEGYGSTVPFPWTLWNPTESPPCPSVRQPTEPHKSPTSLSISKKTTAVHEE